MVLSAHGKQDENPAVPVVKKLFESVALVRIYELILIEVSFGMCTFFMSNRFVSL